MGSLTQFAQKKVLDHLLKTASYSPPATVYLGLSTADPTDDASGWADPTYTGYARKAITFAAAGSRAIAQTGAVTFDKNTSGSSIATHWGLWEGESTGDLLAYGQLSASKEIKVNNTPSIATAQVTVTFNAAGVFTPLANAILDWLFRAQTLAQPTHVKIALSTTIPTDGGPNITEPVAANYGQVEFDTWNAATLATPSLADNDGDIVFGAPSGSWGTLVYGVVYLDTSPFAYLDVTDQLVGVGDTVKFLSGDLNVTLN